MDCYGPLDLNREITCDQPLPGIFDHCWHSKIKPEDLLEIDTIVRHEVGLTLSAMDNLTSSSMQLRLYKSKNVKFNFSDSQPED